jgi:hypothetical protein
MKKTIHSTFCFLISIQSSDPTQPMQLQDSYTSNQLSDFGADLTAYLQNTDAAAAAAKAEATQHAATLIANFAVPATYGILELSVARTELPWDLQEVRDRLMEAASQAAMQPEPQPDAVVEAPVVPD